MKASAYALSDVGRCRESNEDNYYLDTKLGVYAVADGMGGHAAGEVASQLAVDALAEVFRRNGEDRPADPEALEHTRERLHDAVAEANRRICESIQHQDEHRGMGTTMVTLVTRGETALIGHVGDSRAYRLRAGELERLTNDHSWVFEQVKAGLLSDSDAQRHPMRNIVTRALGSRNQVTMDLTEADILSGDVFLLCSDGLNAMLEDPEIRDTLGRHDTDPQAACQALVDAANTRGGEDNTTVIVLACR